MNQIELRPDQPVIVEVGGARQGNLRTNGQHHFGLGSAFRGQKVAAVDHCSGQVAMVDHRTGAGSPGTAGVMLESLGGEIAEEFHAAAPDEMKLGTRMLL